MFNGSRAVTPRNLHKTDRPSSHSTTSAGSLPRWLIQGMFGAALIMFVCSAARHLLFQSTAFDLGIYDQAVYLLSQGLPPISSYLGFHHMGNHAAYSVYPLALLYGIYPSVYWLLGVQAVCLASGVLPTWLLARQAGLASSMAGTMAIVYLLYPLVFNVNLFDFHPEVMALPVILAAIWAARADRFGWFCAAIVFVLGCKDSLSPMVAAMGIWLFFFEKRRKCGGFALIAGTSWFFIVTQWLIPSVSGAEVAAVGRYAEWGDSVLEIAQNLLLNPGLLLGKLFSQDTAHYLGLLVFPLIWGLFPQHMAPLISAIPTLTFNILSAEGTQRDLTHQYSLPILPFLLVVVIDTLAANRGWLRHRRWIILWSLIAFLWLGEYDRFWNQYLRSLDTLAARQEAVAMVPAHVGGVMADNYVAAHLSQRSNVYLALPRKFKAQLPNVDYVLLNLRTFHQRDRERAAKIKQRLETEPAFELAYQRDGVYVFVRKNRT